MKKTISLILAFLMCFSVVMPTFAATAEETAVAYETKATPSISNETKTEKKVDKNINSSVSIKAVTGSGTTTDGFAYEIIDRSYAEITDYTGSAKEVVIPSAINGYPVTSIGDEAFYECTSLTITSIEIPDSVTSIGNSAFWSCDSLKSITLGNSVTSIGSYAFRYCSSLTSIEIPDSVTSIGAFAFDACYYLTSIEIPDSVTSIGDYAFYRCYYLTSIEIPDSVTSIGESAFYACSSLTSIEVSENNANYCDVDGVMFNKDKTTLIRYPEGKIASSYTIPDSVTSIGDSAFKYCRALTSIEIPDSVTSIGDDAFIYCDSLTSIEIPDSVTSIGDDAFYSCDSLTSIEVVENNENYCDLDGVLFNKDKTTLVKYPEGKTASSYTIPDSVTSIGGDAFRYCDSLTSIIIPDSVTSIGDYAFYYCEYLTSIEIPDSVTSIGNYVFSCCFSLTSIEIPDSVMSTGDGAFEVCDSLTSVTIGNSVESIGDYAFRYCDSLKSIIIPDSVTSIGLCAFDDCDNLTIYGISGSYAETYANENDIPFVATDLSTPESTIEPTIDPTIEPTTEPTQTATPVSSFKYNIVDNSYVEITGFIGSETEVVIPSEIDGYPVTSIGDEAFSWCESLTSIEIPDSVTSIGDCAFAGCYSLTSIEIPDSVTSIGYCAFAYCDSLTSIEIPDSVTSIDYYAFEYCDSLTSIKIPNSVTSIGEDAFRYCDSLTSIEVVENNENYCDLDGVLFNKDKTTLVKYPEGKTASSYTIPDSVTSIGNSAFAYCSSLTSIEIPDSVTSIGDDAFYSCSSLTSIEIPDGVTSIGDSAFDFCDFLTSIEVVENNENYCDLDGVLFNKDKTTLVKYPEGKTANSYTIPDSVTSIGDYVFGDCDSLTSIEIPDSVTSIDDDAFNGCDSLTSIEIPDSVTSIGDYAFGSCDSLTSVTLGNGVMSIGEYTFSFCDSLTSIEIPDSVTSIGDYAFWYCDNLTIYGISGSYAETYANENDIPFVATDLSTPESTIEPTIDPTIEPTTEPTAEPIQTATPVSSFKYNIVDNSYVKITDFIGLETEVVIPSEIKGHPVKNIGYESFYSCESLTSIVIPDSVTTIDDRAFAGCISLANVDIPNGVASIGWNAFAGCTSLTNVDIPNSVISIGNSAFYNCVSLTSVTIGNGVKNSPSAFYNCTSLTNVNIGNGVTNIDDGMFEGCTSLTSIEIPNSVTSIGCYAFYNCSSLTNIEIPDSVTGIDEHAFYCCSSLTSIEIPDSVTSIGWGTFADCSFLTIAIIPDSVTSISNYAFSDCDNLTIYGISGSYAETYANEHDIPFVAISDDGIFSRKAVAYAAQSVSNYVENNSKFPRYLTLDGEKVYMPELLGILAEFVMDTNTDFASEALIPRNDAVFAETSYEAITGKTLTKAQYVALAQEVVEYISLYLTAPGSMKTEIGTLSFETMLKVFADIGAYARSENKLPESVSVTAWEPALPTPPADNETIDYQYVAFEDILSGATFAKTATESNGTIPAYVTVTDDNVRLYQGTMLAMFTKTIVGIDRGKTSALPIEEITVFSRAVDETITSCTLTKAEYLNLASRIAKSIDSTGALPKYCTTSYGTINTNNMIYIFARVLDSYKTNGTLPDTVDVQAWGTYEF